MSDVALEMLAVNLAGAPSAALTRAALAEHAAPAQDELFNEEPGAAREQDEQADDARILLDDNSNLILDPLGAACLLRNAREGLQDGRAGEFLDVTLLGNTLGRVITFAWKEVDGSVTESVLMPDGMYETQSGFFISVQRNENYSIILWCKWASFTIHCLNIIDLKIRVNRELIEFLFDYIGNAVQWPRDVDPLVKMLSALTSYSYDSSLYITSFSVGMSTNKLYPTAFVSNFARSISKKPLACRAFYILCMAIHAQVLAYNDAVYKDGSLDQFRAFMEMMFPRNDGDGTPTIWRAHEIVECGVHELYDLLDQPAFRLKFSYDCIFHSAHFAQLVMHFNNAPRVKNLDTMLYKYLNWQTTSQRNQFEPIDNTSFLSAFDEGEVTVSESSSGRSSPIESSRRCLAKEFESNKRMRLDEVLDAVEADAKDD